MLAYTSIENAIIQLLLVFIVYVKFLTAFLIKLAYASIENTIIQLSLVCNCLFEICFGITYKARLYKHRGYLNADAKKLLLDNGYFLLAGCFTNFFYPELYYSFNSFVGYWLIKRELLNISAK